MKNSSQTLKKTAFVFYLGFIHILAAMFIYHEFIIPYFTYGEVKIETVDKLPEKEENFPTPQPFPSIAEVQTPAESDFNSNQENSSISNNVNRGNSLISNNDTTLMIPVLGIKRGDLQDTYTDSRSEGRVHNAIDIIAPLGTPVVAASDGEIVKFFDSERGGITIYQFSPDKHFIYYYAHLQKRAENLQENAFVKKGTVIGYVGDTGNSGEGNFHLHFEVMISEDSKSYWKGTDINPYPLLKNGIESR
ncbi:MAG: M23 family metallopeptidase [Acidobacteriota bacterium]